MKIKHLPPKAQEACLTIGRIYLFHIILALVRDGVITREDLNNKDNLVSLVKKNITRGVKKTRAGVSMHDNFFEFHKIAMKKKDRFVAIVLFATAIENRLNETIRLLAESKGIKSGDITRLLKLFRIEDKLTWAYHMYGGKAFPKKFKRTLSRIFEIRNQIAHYKSIDCHPDLEEDSYSLIEKEIASLGQIRMNAIYDRFMQYTYDDVIKNDQDMALAFEVRESIDI